MSTFYGASTQAQRPICNHTDTFQQQNMQPSYQPGVGPTSTGLISTEQLHSYGGMSSARSAEHRNAEAGPSTLPIPYSNLVTPHPSGGLSETTAYAEYNQPNTEEDGIPVSNLYCSHILHVSEWLFSIGRPSGPEVKDHPARTAYG